MKSVIVNLPDADAFNTFNISVYLAAKMYEDGILTTGQAADVANLTKRAFIEIMGKYGVSIFGNDINDLKNDITNA
jgi:hypothetical protein